MERKRKVWHTVLLALSVGCALVRCELPPCNKNSRRASNSHSVSSHVAVTQIVSVNGSQVFWCGLRRAIRQDAGVESKRTRAFGLGGSSPGPDPPDLPRNETEDGTPERKAPESRSKPEEEEEPGGQERHRHFAKVSGNVPTYWGYPGPPEAEAGVLMTVLHPRTGRQLLRRAFDTSQPYASWADLVWFLSQVTEGHILVLTLSRSGAAGLRHARDVLTSWGSLLVEYVGMDSLWSWVMVKGGRTIAETLVTGVAGHVPEGTNLLVEGVLALSTTSQPRSTSRLETSRWNLCESQGGLAGLCDETAPDTLRWPTPPTSGIVAEVPVVITTGNRLQYLYHSLRQLLRCPGAAREKIVAVVDSMAPEVVRELLDLLGIESVQVEAEGAKNFKLFQYYRGAFQLAADRFPNAPAVIFMDEDVYPSPDFFSFFNQTLGLLQADPSLYCIALNTETAKGRGAHYVRRIASQVNWGYAVSPSFIQEALSLWPKNSSEASILLYDYWLYEVVRGDRECLVPEVLRSRHYGLGVNTKKMSHERAAWGSPLLADAGVTLRNLHQVTLKEYERIILQDLREAYVLGPWENPCRPSFSSKLLTMAEGKKRSFVLYYRRINSEDIKSWYLLGRCSGLYAEGKQGHHRGVHIAYYPLQLEKGRSTTSKRHNNASVPYRHLEGNDTNKWSITDLSTYGNVTINNTTPSDAGSGHRNGSGSMTSLLVMKNSVAFHSYSEDLQTAQPKDADDFVTVYFVGVPFSFYSPSRPKGAYVFDVNDLTDAIHDKILSALDDTVESLSMREGEPFDALKSRLFAKDSQRES